MRHPAPNFCDGFAVAFMVACVAGGWLQGGTFGDGMALAILTFIAYCFGRGAGAHR